MHEAKHSLGVILFPAFDWSISPAELMTTSGLKSRKMGMTTRSMAIR